MRQPLRPNPSQRAVASTKSIPAPVGGWNARDSLAQMPESDAVILDNWFPEASFVRNRGGSQEFADTQSSDLVESLMAYTGLTTKKFFAASGGDIYNVSAGGTIAAPDLTARTNNRWQYTNFGNVAGNWLVMANGEDAPQIYNGTTWADWNVTGTGLTPANLIQPANYQNRLWAAEKGKLWAWYLPIAAISGTLIKFDLTGFASLGGYLMTIITWSRDSGTGPDDYIIFFTSEGELLVYKGVDPSSATDFALSSIYRTGKPIGRRCFLKIGSEVVLLTNNGFIPISKLVNFGRETTGIAISDKIKDAVSTVTTTYFNNFGWQAMAYPNKNMALFNIPIAEGLEQQQYVVNTQTGAWCRFIGLDANCLEVFDDDLFYGANDGKVYQMEVGTSDGDGTVDTEALQAYSYFSARGRQKRFTMVKPTMRSTGILTISAKISVDFIYNAPTLIYAAGETSGSAWDVSPWDVSPWADSFQIRKGWKVSVGQGNAAAVGVKTSTKYQSIEWLSTDFIVEIGGFIQMPPPQMLYGQSKLIKDFVCAHIKEFDKDLQEGMYEGIGIVQDGKLIAGAIYSEYRPPVDIREAFAAISPTWANKATLRNLFWYPFNHLKVRRMTAIIGSKNKISRDVTERLGFKQEGICRASMDDGDDAIIYGMLKEECRWIK